MLLCSNENLLEIIKNHRLSNLDDSPAFLHLPSKQAPHLRSHDPYFLVQVYSCLSQIMQNESHLMAYTNLYHCIHISFPYDYQLTDNVVVIDTIGNYLPCYWYIMLQEHKHFHQEKEREMHDFHLLFLWMRWYLDCDARFLISRYCVEQSLLSYQKVFYHHRSSYCSW